MPYKSIQDLLSMVRFLIKPLHDLTYTTYYIQFPMLCPKQLRGSVERDKMLDRITAVTN